MVSLALVAGVAGGCAASHKTVVKPGEAPAAAQIATREQLIERYNAQANAVQTLNAGVAMKLTSGSAYSGVIEQYHEVNGFLLAAKPASIRVIGQAPVIAKNIFDMVSDGQTFEVSIPSKHKFVVGPVNVARQSAKPIENLRPQHLTEALLWAPIAAGEPVLIEESSESNVRYYVLTIIRPAAGADSASAAAGTDNFEIVKKVWFERGALKVSRVETFGHGGVVGSDVRYSDWQPAGGALAGAGSAGAAPSYPREIDIARPGEDYQLAIHINKLTLNEPIPADRFTLKQPPGSDLVRISEDGTQNTEPAHKEPQP
jgi:outer membrane lipoprotein-sorting protein